MNTKPCMSSHNKKIIILIYTKDWSDIEGYKNQTNFVAQKMAASEVARKTSSCDTPCVKRDVKPGICVTVKTRSYRHTEKTPLDFEPNRYYLMKINRDS